MQLKFLFWLAVILAVIGMHLPDGNLFYFFAVHLTMLMIGLLLLRREKRGRGTPGERRAVSKPSTPVAKSKAA
ncbi:MAG: hypothetical protein ACM3KE_04570 [Hyphomicrobiales bacterium]